MTTSGPRQNRATAALETAGAAATRETPLARLQMEADGDTRSAALTLMLWPGGESFVLGRGRRIEWSGAGPRISQLSLRRRPAAPQRVSPLAREPSRWEHRPDGADKVSTRRRRATGAGHE